MRRYQFRLDPVLRVRRIEQDTAQAHLALARRELAAAEAALLDAVDRYRSAPGSPGSQPAAAWLVQRTGAQLTAASVIALGGQRERAASAVDERRASLHEARRRVVALERLDERRRVEHGTELLRDEALEVDELVVNRWGRAT